VPPDPDQPGTDPQAAGGPPDPPGAGGTGGSGSVALGSVALVHDYLTQRGGAERVVLALATEYPAAPIHTSLYDPDGTFPEFAGLDVRTTPLDRVALLRRHHRLALPLLAPAFSRLQVDAGVVICSSSGWAHGARVHGRKVVYCHTPARWLYQSDRYLDGQSKASAAALSLMAPPLRAWDRRAAASADRYLVNSTAVQRRVSELYGIDAEVVPPPVDVDPYGAQEPVAGLEPGFILCVSRLLAYKNVEAVTAAFRQLPGQRLVVVGSGPLADHIAATRPPNVTVLGRVTDASLRWLYASSSGLVAASYEDFGLTPVEAASFGRPTAALRWGGFLDTIVEGSTGVFFDEPQPQLIARAVEQMSEIPWSESALMAHARQFSPARFAQRLQAVVAEELAAP
jgi:glycosyltransferase involved in cell wall biosynthesis